MQLLRILRKLGREYPCTLGRSFVNWLYAHYSKPCWNLSDKLPFDTQKYWFTRHHSTVVTVDPYKNLSTNLNAHKILQISLWTLYWLDLEIDVHESGCKFSSDLCPRYQVFEVDDFANLFESYTKILSEECIHFHGPNSHESDYYESGWCANQTLDEFRKTRCCTTNSLLAALKLSVHLLMIFLVRSVNRSASNNFPVWGSSPFSTSRVNRNPRVSLRDSHLPTSQIPTCKC